MRDVAPNWSLEQLRKGITRARSFGVARNFLNAGSPNHFGMEGDLERVRIWSDYRMATMIPNDVEEFQTEDERVFFRFLQSVARPDPQ